MAVKLRQLLLFATGLAVGVGLVQLSNSQAAAPFLIVAAVCGTAAWATTL